MSSNDTSVHLSGGGAAAKAAQVFRRMDNDNNGGLDFGEMLQALKELGVLDGIQAAEATKVLQKELKEADTDNNGLIDFQEFQHYFQRMALYQQNESRKQRLSRKSVPLGADRNPALKSCFRQFCQHGKTHIIGAGSMTNVSLESLRMTSRQFNRFCKELGVVQPHGEIEPMTVDVIFAQCKVAGDRSISFKGFLETLSMIAEGSDLPYEEIVALVSQHTPLPPSDQDKTLKTPRRKSTTMSRPSTPSIVAQTWKKANTSYEPGAYSQNSRLSSSMSNLDKPSLNKDVQKLIEQAAQSFIKAHSDLSRLQGYRIFEGGCIEVGCLQARAEGAKQAAEEWEEEKQSLEEHIQHLQGLLSTVQENDGEQKTSGGWESNISQGKKYTPKHSKKEMDDLRGSLMKDLQERIDVLGAHLQEQRPDTGGASAINKLRLQVVQLEDVVSHMQETQSSFTSTGSGTLGRSLESAPAADLEEAIQALEERALERQTRLEAAMLQIATKVDLLEEKISAFTG